MKKITLLFVFINLSFAAVAQTTPSNTFKKNSIYLEVYGNSGKTISINYEKTFIKNEKTNYLGTRIGFGYFNRMKNNSRYHLTLPIGLNYTFQGIKFNNLEIGIGFLFQLETIPTNSYRDISTFYTSNICYKYINDSGLFFKASFVLISDPYGNEFDRLNPWGGISLGYTF